jgi:hypothetical protein
MVVELPIFGILDLKLNSSVSNGPWLGEDGKKAALNEKDVLLLNSKVQMVGNLGWTEELIRSRTSELTTMILDIWKAPEGHVSKVNRAKDDVPRKISVIDLISAGLLRTGQTLYPSYKRYKGRNAQILADGRIEVEGEVFDSLSVAGNYLRKKNTNGWTFWLINEAPKEKLFDVREKYKEIVGVEGSEDLSDDETDEEE